MPELAVLDAPQRVDPHVKLGIALLKGAVQDLQAPLPRRKGNKRTDALLAAAEAEMLLFPKCEHGWQHFEWVMDLAKCSPESWRRRLDGLQKSHDVELRQLVHLRRFILDKWPELAMNL